MNFKEAVILSVVFILLMFCFEVPAMAEVKSGSEDTITMAFVGDVISTRSLKPFDDPRDPRFQEVISVIKAADAAMLNLEESLFRMSEFKGWPEAETGGQWELGPPEAAGELKEMGFDLMARANNHATDYGVEGMRLTDRLLDEVGIVYAGTGMNLGQASRPGYFDTIKGRVGLVSFASSFTESSRSGASRDDVPGRPGLNALRLKRKYQVDEKTFKTLCELAPKIGGKVYKDKKTLRAFQVRSPYSHLLIEAGEGYYIEETPNKRDEERILHEINNATKLSDFVIATCHAHQPWNKSVLPPNWMGEFAKKCIDAGAVAFVGHGPHQLRGIEIYKDRPIFYSLGNFIFQNETIDPLPADDYEKYDLPSTALAGEFFDKRTKTSDLYNFEENAVWYESVIAVPRFEGGGLAELKLYPIELAHKAPRSQRGTPRMAKGKLAEKIIKHLAELSEPFGTEIEFKDGIGVWVR